MQTPGEFIVLTGRLTGDPWLRYEPDGTPVTGFDVRPHATDSSTTATPTPGAYTVELRGPAADHAAESLLMDMPVLVHGTTHPDQPTIQATACGPDLTSCSVALVGPFMQD